MYDLEGINEIESSIDYKHVIVLLFVKPSDKNSEEILEKLNYLHHKSGKYCSIYLIGYAQNFMGQYKDVKIIEGPDCEEWEYSDKCFIGVCDNLQKRLKNWSYSGEPELIILQNMIEKTNSNLDFRGYVYIDINYGIRKKYIDSFSRFMERFLCACKYEVEAEEAIVRANRNRIKCRNVLEMAIENMPRLPKPVKLILKDRLFYKTFKN